MMRPTAALLSMFALGACVHGNVLQPAPGAVLVPGSQNVAEATAAGVTVRATGDSWKGEPRDLGKRFTPVRVTIRNDSGNLLRVTYADFSLAGASGFRYAAITPMQARGTLTTREPPASPPLRLSRWEPLHSDYLYPDPWAGPFGDRAPFYDGLYANHPEQLPARDTLSDALPEGVVQDGGRVEGFVYFESVNGRESAVEFEMILSDARDGHSFGRVAIPFQTTLR